MPMSSRPDQALPLRRNIADTVDAVNAAVRRDIKYGADWIKLHGNRGRHGSNQ